jgi:hypothetical protein
MEARMNRWRPMLYAALSAYPLAGAAAQTPEPQMAAAVGELFPGPDKACGVFSLYVSAKLLGASPDLLGISSWGSLRPPVCRSKARASSG